MHSVVVDRDNCVEMRDRVGLATDVYRPQGDGASQTLVQHILYDKDDAQTVGGLMVNPIEAVSEGYAVVV